jgi:hypothetical protein
VPVWQVWAWLGSGRCEDEAESVRELQESVLGQAEARGQEALMNWKLTVVLTLVMLLFVACKDAERQQFEALGSKHRITVYSGGQKVAEFESTGNVSNESNSDGWYFRDAKSGKLVEVTGTLVIEQL